MSDIEDLIDYVDMDRDFFKDFGVSRVKFRRALRSHATISIEFSGQNIYLIDAKEENALFEDIIQLAPGIVDACKQNNVRLTYDEFCAATHDQGVTLQYYSHSISPTHTREDLLRAGHHLQDYVKRFFFLDVAQRAWGEDIDTQPVKNMLLYTIHQYMACFEPLKVASLHMQTLRNPAITTAMNKESGNIRSLVYSLNVYDGFTPVQESGQEGIELDAAQLDATRVEH